MGHKAKGKAIFFSVLMLILVLGVTVAANWDQISRKLPGKSAKTETAKEDSAKEADSDAASKFSKLEKEQEENLSEEQKEDEAAKLNTMYFADGFAGANPEKQSGEDLKKFLQDETFFDAELSSFEKKLAQANDKHLYFVITSVEQDMRIQVRDHNGAVITGIPFFVNLKDHGSYKDQDEDGVIYISNLTPGDYEVSMDQAEIDDFIVPRPTVVTVKEKVEYVPIADISLLIKTEEEIIAEKEDTGEKNALQDADTTEVKDIRELGESGQIGIDVSRYNGDIDWNKVRDAGIHFAIIRAGYRGSSSGALVEDPKFKENMTGALYAGLKAGIYFFTQATNEVEAVEEASMVLELCKNYKFQYPIFIDTEGAGGNGRADNLDLVTRTAVCKAFCQTIESAGYTSGVYASRNWFNKNLNRTELEDYLIWLAEYRETPEYIGPYQMWQYTSSGNVDGISGRVDLDISYLAY